MFDHLLGSTIACGCGREHTVATRRIHIDRAASAEVGPTARALDLPGPLLLVADPDTWQACGPAVRQSLEGSGYHVDLHVLERHPTAGPPTIRSVAERLGSHGALVAVGAGTVNDITKSAAHDAGLPYIAVGTALSMNGYTSAISALLEGGVKRTVTVTPPVAVVLDLDVCAAAPRAMTLAGLGDMLSKPFSEADWRLSHQIDGGYYCSRPGAILDEAFRRMLAEAPAIGRADPDALRSLAEAIALSGISMAMAGASSPASGGEHLISHYWDMLCHARHAPLYGLHGTQVGVACCLVEPLYGRVVGLETIDIDACLAAWPSTRESARDHIWSRHPDLPDPVRQRVVEEGEQKWRMPGPQKARLTDLAARLQPILEHVGAALLEPGAVHEALATANAPTTPGDLSPELAGGLDQWIRARDMRSRYTVLDFAVEAGLAS